MTSRRLLPRDRASARRLAFGAAGLGACAVLALSTVDNPVGDTLASYKDREFAQFGLTAGSWNMQGSTDHTDAVAGTWSDHFSSSASLTLSSSKVTPRISAYAPFSLRLAQGSLKAGTITLKAGSIVSDPANVVSKFTTRIVSSPSGKCDSSVFPTSSGSGRYLLGEYNSRPAPTATPVAATSTFTLPAATASAPGSSLSACFEFGVTDDSSANGKSVSVKWTFSGVSQ